MDYKKLFVSDSILLRSHQCAICEKLEYQGADIVSTECWICPECRAALRSLIIKQNPQTQGIMKYHD